MRPAHLPSVWGRGGCSRSSGPRPRSLDTLVADQRVELLAVAMLGDLKERGTPMWSQSTTRDPPRVTRSFDPLIRPSDPPRATWPSPAWTPGLSSRATAAAGLCGRSAHSLPELRLRSAVGRFPSKPKAPRPSMRALRDHPSASRSSGLVELLSLPTPPLRARPGGGSVCAGHPRPRPVASQSCLGPRAHRSIATLDELRVPSPAGRPKTVRETALTRSLADHARGRHRSALRLRARDPCPQDSLQQAGAFRSPRPRRLTRSFDPLIRPSDPPRGSRRGARHGRRACPRARLRPPSSADDPPTRCPAWAPVVTPIPLGPRDQLHEARSSRQTPDRLALAASGRWRAGTTLARGNPRPSLSWRPARLLTGVGEVNDLALSHPVTAGAWWWRRRSWWWRRRSWWRRL